MRNTESWSSKIGFILSAAGSAIGLGAIWKFPYTLGTSGGAVFLLLFIAFTLLVGLPVLLAEFAIGRSTRQNAIAALRALAPDSLWPWLGRIGVATCFVILSFYSVVGGWVVAYLYHTLNGDVAASTDFAALFAQIISNPAEVLLCQAAFMLTTMWVVQSGVSQGIEKANRYLMPALFVLFVLLAARSLTLPGAMAGVRFLFQPDWAYLNSQTALIALGQAFFALSLGVAVMITYASYLNTNSDLFRAGNSVVWLNLLISLLSGLVIFPAVFALGFEPNQGPGLIFVVLPAVFQQMPWGSLLFGVFMLLVLFATLTSAFSILENISAAASRGDSRQRQRYTWLMGILVYLAGIPSALSFGPWAGFTPSGKSIFEWLDYLTTAWSMPLGALLVAVFVGWHWHKEILRHEILLGSNVNPRWFGIWYVLVKYIAPLAITVVFLRGIGVL